MGILLFKKKKIKKQGYTLIELLIIIVLIGIIAAIGFQQYVQVQGRAANSVHEANTRLLKGAGKIAVFVWGFPEEEVKLTKEDGNSDPNNWGKGWRALLHEWPDVPKDSLVYEEGSEYVIIISEKGNVGVAVE